VKYHEATKHSYNSIRSNAHFMDWNNQPLPFKIYPTLEPIRLPGEVRQSGVAALRQSLREFPPRPTQLRIWKRWRSCCTFPRASREEGNIPAVNLFSGGRLYRGALRS